MAGAFKISSNIDRDADLTGYAAPRNEPAQWRSLKVYALDPSLSRQEGAIATVRVPYEPLAPGPRGSLFVVDTGAPYAGTKYRGADLESSEALHGDGYVADAADSRFHAQMVYAIASLTYESFRRALGRMTGWSFRGQHAQFEPLVLRPFAMEAANAFYSRSKRGVSFGYFKTDEASLGLPEAKYVFTSLSSDIITHEVTHAILDGLRGYFGRPVNADVPAFHEAFADLLAIFQRFAFRELTESVIRRVRGDISERSLLGALAPEVARAMGDAWSLRTLVTLPQESDPSLGPLYEVPVEMGPSLSEEPHQRGRLLAEAVFEAFTVIVKRRVTPFIRLASGGTGELPPGELPAELLKQIVRITARVAEQFRTICIRAIDYCPPVDLEFGDYLRALITADYALVREDPYGYREAIINAFRRRNIYPRHVRTLSETALLWNGPEHRLPAIPRLSLSALKFKGDPAIPADAQEVRAQAQALGEAVTGNPAFMAELGLSAPGPSADGAEDVQLPEIVSIRPARRAGPDGQMGFDMVAEVVQARHLRLPNGTGFIYHGGATIILDQMGEVSYVVRKRVEHHERAKRQMAFAQRAVDQGWFVESAGKLVPRPDSFQHFCFLGSHTIKETVATKLPVADGQESGAAATDPQATGEG